MTPQAVIDQAAQEAFRELRDKARAEHGKTSTRHRDFADIWVTSRRHRIEAPDLRSHMFAVAADREQPVMTMAEALTNMPDRQRPYERMIERLSYLSPPPKQWTDLIDGVIDFVDPLLSGDEESFSHWDPRHLSWL